MQISLKLLVFAILFLSFLNTSKSLDSLYLRYNTLGIEVQCGYAAHDVKAIQNVRDQALKKLPFPAKVTDDYPYIPYLQGEFLYMGKKFEFGVLFSFVTTGSRAHYADYSGEYKFEGILSNYEYGLIFKTRSANENAPFRLQFWSELGFASLKYKTKQFFKVYNQVFTNISNKQSNTVNYIELGLNANYYYKGFYFNGGVSYYAEFPYDFYFLIEEPYDVNIGFSGVRAHLGVGYKF